MRHAATKYTKNAVLLLAACLIACCACGAEVPLWSTQDFTFVSTTAPASNWNGYTSSFSADGLTSTFNVTFTAPAGTGIADQTVRAFYDGLDQSGNAIYRARFTPTTYSAGDWSYATTASVPGITAFTPQQPTAFTVGATPNANDHGFLRVDPNHSRKFVWDDGTHPFLWGQTYYDVMQSAMQNDNWKTAIDNIHAYGVSKIRLNVYTFNFERQWPQQDRGYPDAQPFTGDASTPDHDSLNIDYWRKLDEVVKYLDDRGMVADLILSQPYDLNRAYGTDAQNDRYIRYITSRYSALTNVMYCVANEWDKSSGEGGTYKQTTDDWNRMGTLVRTTDPWFELDDGPRPLSIHRQGGNTDFGFNAQAWPSHVTLQYGGWNTGGFTNGDDFGNYGIVANFNRNKPIVNDEYGYVGQMVNNGVYSGSVSMTPDVLRRTAWGIAVGGGYGSIGDWRVLTDTATGTTWTPSCTGEWADAPEYADLNRLIDFFSNKGIEFWKMTGRNDLQTEGNRTYVLAEPGSQYVVYDANGGSFKLDLDDGVYEARLFDPQTGADARIGTVIGGPAPLVLHHAQPRRLGCLSRRSSGTVHTRHARRRSNSSVRGRRATATITDASPATLSNAFHQLM